MKRSKDLNLAPFDVCTETHPSIHLKKLFDDVFVSNARKITQRLVTRRHWRNRLHWLRTNQQCLCIKPHCLSIR